MRTNNWTITGITRIVLLIMMSNLIDLGFSMGSVVTAADDSIHLWWLNIYRHYLGHSSVWVDGDEDNTSISPLTTESSHSAFWVWRRLHYWFCAPFGLLLIHYSNRHSIKPCIVPLCTTIAPAACYSWSAVGNEFNLCSCPNKQNQQKECNAI